MRRMTGVSASWLASISDDEISNSTYDYGGGQWNALMFSGSGSASGSGGYSNYGGNNGNSWEHTDAGFSWSPVDSGADVSKTVSITYTGSPLPTDQNVPPVPTNVATIPCLWDLDAAPSYLGSWARRCRVPRRAIRAACRLWPGWVSTSATPGGGSLPAPAAVPASPAFGTPPFGTPTLPGSIPSAPTQTRCR